MPDETLKPFCENCIKGKVCYVRRAFNEAYGKFLGIDAWTEEQFTVAAGEAQRGNIAAACPEYYWCDPKTTEAISLLQEALDDMRLRPHAFGQDFMPRLRTCLNLLMGVATEPLGPPMIRLTKAQHDTLCRAERERDELKERIDRVRFGDD